MVDGMLCVGHGRSEREAPPVYFLPDTRSCASQCIVRIRMGVLRGFEHVHARQTAAGAFVGWRFQA
jgi:hypothetical protein